MTKSETLNLLQLLSALESIMLSNKFPVPDYLHDQLTETIKLARDDILN